MRSALRKLRDDVHLDNTEKHHERHKRRASLIHLKNKMKRDVFMVTRKAYKKIGLWEEIVLERRDGGR